jgi:hypothetical protein
MQYNNRGIATLTLVLVFLIVTIAFAQTDSEPIQMEFVSDLSMGIPIQDVYIDAGVIRPLVEESMPADILSQQVYSSTRGHAADYELPYDVGPFERGEALGFTVGDWIAINGTGTYTRDGDRAIIDLEFESLEPGGLYTMWCYEITVGEGAADAPCGALDGSEAEFMGDEDGHASWTLEMDAFPPSTAEKFYGFGPAYHSDGINNGQSAGDFGRNAHVPMWFDFTPEYNDLEVVEVKFLDDFDVSAPLQDVYIDAGVVRPEGEMTPDMLEQPIYGVTVDNPPDFFEPPFDVGPYDRGAALGITLGDWLSATGTGTYNVNGDQATLDLQFENLVPEGVYTLWCNQINFAEASIVERPCGALSGSENTFVADDEGNLAVTLEIDAFPAPTDEIINEVALAYHSDGQTYGRRAGEFGHNVHVQLVYDFLVPSEG